MVTPENNIKFQLKRDVYKNSTGVESAKVHEKKPYAVINNNILNLGLLRSNKNCFVGQKYNMKKIIDIARVLALKLNQKIKPKSKSNQYFNEFKRTFEKIGKK